jgi:hypothetical protein
MEKTSDGSFARITRKTAEDDDDEREGLGHDAKQIPGCSRASAWVGPLATTALKLKGGRKLCNRRCDIPVLIQGRTR